MEKNWLIRTKSNHILGPVSKEKVLELFKNGSLKANDEICTGNGFWFFIREEDMVERYLIGNAKQPFNPLSEAKNVLTQKEEPHVQEPTDITLIGSINLDEINDEVPESSEPQNGPVEKSNPKKSSSVEDQKKNQPKLRVAKQVQKKVAIPKTKHTYLRVLFLFFFLILLSLTYYRKKIIQYFFDGEMTRVSLFQSAYAQTEVLEVKKKGFFDDIVSLEGISFSPEAGLNGFAVVSQIEIQSFKCDDLKNDAFRLALLLFPTDRFTEKFLIKMRECIVKNSSDSLLTEWLKSIDHKVVLTRAEQKRKNLLIDVLNSPYNLITDLNLKTKLTSILIKMPEDTLGEILLKSWLYLMAGNITRSDNLLKDFINTSPYENWKKTSVKRSFYHSLSNEFIDAILEKLAKHPSDRLMFRLFCEYVRQFYHDEMLVYRINKLSDKMSRSEIGLEYVKRMAPALVNHLRLKSMPDSKRMQFLKDVKNISLDEQTLWDWPFFSIDPIITDALYPVLAEWEKTDQLWFIYLLNSEKLVDLWSKNSGKSFIHGRRQYLRSQLHDQQFMLSLFQLIKLGDIDSSLVEVVGAHLRE